MHQSLDDKMVLFGFFQAREENRLAPSNNDGRHVSYPVCILFVRYFPIAVSSHFFH